VSLSFAVPSPPPDSPKRSSTVSKTNPLRPLFVADRPGGKYENTINLTLKHGVKSALEYSKSGDLAAAHQVSNPDNAA
jgi:alkaline phosphatase D